MTECDLLIFADSAQCADMRYAVGVEVSEPFIYLRVKGRGYALLGDSDVDRGREQAKNCRVLSLSRYESRVGTGGSKRAGLAAVINRLASEKGARRLLVPSGFPLGLARELRRLKVRVKPRRGEFFFPERELKTAREVEMIRAALVMAEVGMAEAIHALKNSKIGPHGRLTYRGSPLASEKLRAIIQVAVLQAGGIVSQTIVAGGRQSCCPHEPGTGPLPANQPIILSISPRSEKTGYHGEITRTVVRGQASETVRRLSAAVCQARDTAFGLVCDGVRAQVVHKAVQNHFAQAGFRSRRCRGAMRGFFDATGHGIGLELEEPPRLTATNRAGFKSGHVLSLEPGLYYPEIGGVRVGDVVVVTRNGARNLTQFETILEL